MPTTDPTTEAVITQIAKATVEDANRAVDAASEAFESGAWSKFHHEERAKILFKMADLLDERAEDFAIREAMDMGMPYADFRNIIMPHCSGLFRFFGGSAMSAMNGGYRSSYEHDLKILTRREPLGVVAAIEKARALGAVEVLTKAESKVPQVVERIRALAGPTDRLAALIP